MGHAPESWELKSTCSSCKGRRSGAKQVLSSLYLKPILQHFIYIYIWHSCLWPRSEEARTVQGLVHASAESQDSGELQRL